MRQSANLPIKKHAAMMRIYDQALSPKSTVAMIPIMEEVLRKRVIQWEQCAASGQVSHALDAPLPVQHQHKKNAYSRQSTDQLNQNVGIEVSYLVYDFCLAIQMSEGKNIHTGPHKIGTCLCACVCLCECVCVCVFIKLQKTAQSGPVILVTPCHSH